MAVVSVCSTRVISERSHGNVMAVWRDRAGGGGDRSPARPLGEVGEQICDDFDEDVNYVVEGCDDFDRDANCVVADRQKLSPSTAQLDTATTSVETDTTSGRRRERRALHAGGTVQNEAWHHVRTYELDGSA